MTSPIITEALRALVERRHLTRIEAAAAMEAIMSGAATTRFNQTSEAEPPVRGADGSFARRSPSTRFPSRATFPFVYSPEQARLAREPPDCGR